MHIVIPAALPPHPYAGELAKHLPERAPGFVELLTRGRATLEAFDPVAAGCTAFEAWQLKQAGYVVENPLPLGAGLGPLLAGVAARASSAVPASIKPQSPLGSIDPVLPPGASAPGSVQDNSVWLADLVHLALGTDHASLITADALAPTLKETQSLLDALAPVWADSGFTATLIDARRLRLRLPPGLVPMTASPNAVAGQPLRAWWATDAASRPWRRIVNEIQMVWHDHPVNVARESRGQLPINGLWLYGGAHPWQSPKAAAPGHRPAVLDALTASASMGDWSAWLDAIATLEASTFRPLLAGRTGAPLALTLTLMGEHRVANIAIAPRSPWLRWLPQSKTNWTHWWSLPA